MNTCGQCSDFASFLLHTQRHARTSTAACELIFSELNQTCFPNMVATLSKRTSKDVKTEVEAIQAAGREIGKSAESARAFLKKHGFITKSNRVAKAYR